MDDVKQCIIVRKDLKMRRGKENSQCAHAAMAFLTSNIQEQLKQFPDRVVIDFKFNKAVRHWIMNSFKKITLQVFSEQELLDVYNKAKEAGLLCNLIQDAGKTEFAGVPTYTVCAIGPAEAKWIDAITGNLELY